MLLKIEEKIGSGSYADVWRAIDILERKVAVKVLRRGAPDYFDALTHAKVLARTQHPNIITVYALETVKIPEMEEECDGIVMEFIDGLTLKSKLEQELLVPKEARMICKALIDGIEHLHAAGIVHGDLHSENILIAGQRVKIIDLLYTNSLSRLTTSTREEKIRRDKRDLTTLMFDIIQRTKIEESAKGKFGLALQDSTMKFSDMRQALNRFVDKSENSAELESSVLWEPHWKKLIDPHFVNTPEYAEAINQKIPDNTIQILLEKVIVDRKIRPENLQIIQKLWLRMRLEARQAVLAVLSDALTQETPDGAWSPLLQMLSMIGPHQWNNLSPDARLRLESVIIKDIKNGYRDYYSNQADKGMLGTWALTFGVLFQNREMLVNALLEKLVGSWYSQNYIAYYLFPLLPVIADTEERKTKLLQGVRAALVHKSIAAISKIHQLPSSWLKELGYNSDGTPVDIMVGQEQIEEAGEEPS